jgi:phosphatidylglycerophosphate synthase
MVAPHEEKNRDSTCDGAPCALPRGTWKERLDDPFNRFYRYPIARQIVRVLVRTPITPNQVSFVQPFLAAAAGYSVTFADHRHLVIGALLFELRAILDCVDGTLARAKKQVSPGGHAIDAVADWLATALLYAGIFWHFRLHPPPDGPWSRYLSVSGVLLLALLQGGLRSFAADHYKHKYTSIFELGVDGTVEELGRKVRALKPGASIFAHVDALIGRAEHLAFEHERFDLDRAEPRGERVALLRRREGTPLCRFVAALWSVSNGDAFLSMVTISILVGRLWEAQLFCAFAGLPWIALVIALSARFWSGRPLLRARARASGL